MPDMSVRPEDGPLQGIRVLDLTWAIAGPVCTRMLADQGAEVIKIESAKSMDPGRMGGPWLHDINTFPDGGGGFSNYNRNKLSAQLNLKSAEGRDLFLRLVEKSDVVVNNYSAGAMDRFGLGYETLRDANPGIILAELSGMGQTGPYKRHFAYGHTLMALAGAYELTGYADGTPACPGYTLPDQASGTMGAFAIISALIWRKTSGRGQHLDLALFSTAAALMAEAQMAALVNGENTTRSGNHEPSAFVHNCYRCAGDDEWCVVAVFDEGTWGRLRGVIGSSLPESPWGASPLDIDTAIEAWTMQRTPREVMERLQAAGVEAAMAQDARQLVDEDEHLRERGYFETYTHIIGEEVRTEGIPFKLSESPGRVRQGGPMYGIDNPYVYGELLGIPEAEIARLTNDGVIA